MSTATTIHDPFGSLLDGEQTVIGERDTDGDGTADAIAYDYDGDGAPDQLSIDTDGDGVADQVVLASPEEGVTVEAYDTDGDGVLDYVEFSVANEYGEAEYIQYAELDTESGEWSFTDTEAGADYLGT